MASSVIRNFVAKGLFKKKGAIASSKAVDFSANILEQRLKNFGIDPDAITSPNELNQILSAVKQVEDQAFSQQFGNMLAGSKFDKKADVLDMTGKKIPEGSGILGGKQIKPIDELNEFKATESDAAIKARLDADNKKGIANIKNKMTEIDDSRFKNKPDPEDMATGGRVGLMAGSIPKIFKLLKDPKKVKQAIDNIFPTGDVKYDATMAAESLVELNPKIFGNKLYDDLDSMTRLDIYDAVISPMMSAQAKALRMKKATKPEKTLQSMKEGKGINMSDPEIAKEFEQFMKQTDPEGVKKLEQTLELDNFDPKGRKKNAQGGRIGLKDGMTRRSFLKILGGLAAVPIVGKFFKLAKAGKTVTKVPIIKTGDVPGKPEWFDALVNKVILEGDDVTKRFATQERQVVHMKKIDDDTSVTVTQDLNDGSIMVDVDDPIRNVMGESGQDTSVQMMLKKGQADETTKGTPADEFSFTENDMRNYMDGPDDYTTEFVENTVDKMSDLTSDLGKIKQYATGKGPTMKQIVESKKRKDMVKFAEENPAEYAANRGPEFDPDYDDYASGGIARMLGE